MTFSDPLLLLVLPLFIVLVMIAGRKSREPGFVFSSDTVIKGLGHSIKPALFRGLFYMRFLSVTLMILALARPQMIMGQKIKKEGIAAVMAIDCSSTMLAEDLKLDLVELVRMKTPPGSSKRINRIDAAKEVAKDFIEARPDDLIGLVAFGAEAFVVCPLTFDHEWLLRSLTRIKVGLIKDGTAIGSGILSSLNALKDVKAKSRVVILLTDGVNNFGQISPMTAAKAARALGIKIYTIGVLSDGTVPYPVKDEYGREKYEEVIIDIREDALKEISNTTGGEYFRATDMETLRESYKEIDRLEKVEIVEKGYEEYEDIFGFFLIPALGLILLEILLRSTFLRKIP